MEFSDTGLLNRIFTCDNDSWFSNEDPLELDNLLNLKHARTTPPGRTSCNSGNTALNLCATQRKLCDVDTTAGRMVYRANFSGEPTYNSSMGVRRGGQNGHLPTPGNWV